MKLRHIDELFVAPVGQDYQTDIPIHKYGEDSSKEEERKKAFGTLLAELIKAKDYLAEEKGGEHLLFTHPDFNYQVRVSLRESEAGDYWYLHLERIKKNYLYSLG